jgi:hypothetical protein
MLQWQKDDALDGYNSLTGTIRSRLTDHLSPSGSWILHIGASRILLFILNEEGDIPNLRICVGIAKDMTVSVFVENKVVSMDRLSWILGPSAMLSRWSQLENILSHYKSQQQQDNLLKVGDVSATVGKLCDILDDIVEQAAADGGCDDVNISCISFCAEQLRLACVCANRRRYSSDMLQFAFLLFTRSSACYRILHTCGNVVLPHVSTLRKLSSILSVVPGTDSAEQCQ